jgi:uncharacterized protein YndB with AHSA1/START domain
LGPADPDTFSSGPNGGNFFGGRQVFTSGLGRWWPRNVSIGKPPMKTAVMETRLGGQWYELAEDGSRANVGKIIVWEPPRRFVMTWDINSQWKPDATVSSELEVRFIPDGANATRVELEHRKFEQMGAEAGESMPISTSQQQEQTMTVELYVFPS